MVGMGGSMASQQARNRRAGSLWETTILNYLRGAGCKAERLRLSGAQDEGDIAWDLGGGHVVVIEAKAEKKLDLASYVREAETEAKNYAARRGLRPDDVEWCVVVKRRNAGAGKAYVITTLEEYIR